MSAYVVMIIISTIKLFESEVIPKSQFLFEVIRVTCATCYFVRYFNTLLSFSRNYL